MAPRGSSKHRPGFHALVLGIGFIVGAVIQQAARLLFPPGAAKHHAWFKPDGTFVRDE